MNNQRFPFAATSAPTITSFFGKDVQSFLTKGKSSQRLLLAFLFMVGGVENSWGQLLKWNTFGNTGLETTEPSLFNATGISTSALTLGAGVVPDANGDRFGGKQWFDTGDTNPTTLAEAVADNDYIEFVVNPTAGYFYNATSLVFNWERSGTGPGSVSLRSSIDGFVSDIGSVTGLPASLTTGNTIAISGHTGLVSAVTFRLYGYAATATGGTGGFDVTSNVINVELNGSAALLSPSSLPSDYFRSITTGDWGTPATWESSPVADFSSGLVSPATLAPNELSGGITIVDMHDVVITTAVTADQIVIAVGGILSQLNNLTLANGPGNDLAVNGTWMWHNSLLNGTGDVIITSGGLLDLVTGSNKQPAVNLTNNGTINWQDGSITFAAPNLIWTNNGMFTVGSGNINVVSGICTITNTGTISKTVGGPLGFENIILDNAGTLMMDNGSVEFSNSTINNSSLINMIVSALVVNAGVTFNWNAGSSLAGSGVLDFIDPSSTLVLNTAMVFPTTISMGMNSIVTGPGNLTCNGPLNLNSINAEINGTGVLTINENSTWNAASINRVTTIASGKTLTMATGTEKWLGANLTNNGSINLQNGNIVYTAPGLTLTNIGTFTISVGNINGGAGNGTITNTGTISKTGGGPLELENIIFNNAGTLMMDNGSVEFSNSTINNSSLINMIGSALLATAGVAFNWDAGSSLTGIGLLDFYNSSSTLTLNTDMVLPLTYTMVMGSNVVGSGNLTCNGILTLNSSDAEINGPGSLTINENCVWNAARINRVTTIASGKTLTMPTNTEKRLGANVTNNGTIDWQNGTIAFTVPGLTWTNAGTFTISGNNTTGGSGSCNFLNTGTVRKTSTGTSTLNAITFTNDGTIQGLGTYDLGNAISGTGNIAPGLSPGIVILNSAQPLSANGNLQIEMLNASGPGTGHDQVQRNGNLTLAGNITVTDNPGVPYGTYTIIDLTGGDISGAFDTEALPPFYTLNIDLINDEVKVTKLAPTSLSTHYFRSIDTGDWGTPDTWESSPVADFSSGLVNPATLVPNASSSGTTIRNTHNVTIFNTAVTADQVVVEVGGTLTQSANITIADGVGEDIIVNGNMAFTGSSQLNGTGSIMVNGTMGMQSAFLNSANITIAATGVLNKTTAGNISTNNSYAGYTITNNGTFNWQDGDIGLYSGSFINTASGTIMVTCDKSLGLYNPSVFTNAGIFTKSAGAGTTSIICGTPGTFNNSGTINVNAGTIEVTGAANGWFYNTGTIAIAATKLFKVNNAFALNAGSTITGAGIFQIMCCLNITASVTATNVVWTGGNISGGGTLTVTGGMEFQAGTLNDANIVLGTGAVSSKTTAGQITFNNSFAGYTLTNQGIFNWSQGDFYRGAGTIVNSTTGQFNASGVSLVTGSNPGTLFQNDGLFTISGIITFNTGHQTTHLLNNGTLAVNGTLTLQNGFQTTGLVNNGNIKGTGTINNTNPFTSNGIIEPGTSPGIITLEGNQPFSGTSTLNIEMNNGGVPGVGHDQVARSSNLTLVGTLNVTETGSVPYGSYTIIDLSAGSITGSFSPANLPVGYSLSVVGNDLVLTKTPPVSLNTHFFRSITTGNWNAPGTWESSPVSDFSSGLVNPATLAPNELSSGITIWNMHNVTVNTPVTADQIVVESASTLTQTTPLTLSNGAGDDLTVNGTWTWHAGALNGAGEAVISTSGLLNIVDGSDRHLGINLTNNGTIDWQDGGLRFPLVGTTLTNNNVFTISGNDGTDQVSGSGHGQWINTASGTLTKTSAGTTSFNHLSMTNAGTLNINGGNMTFANGTITNTSAISMTGSTLSVDVGVTFNWSGGASMAGSGTLNFINPGSWLALNADMVMPSTISMVMASNVSGAGNLTCNGPLTLNSYYTEINGTGTLAINENSTWNAARVNRATTIASGKTLTLTTSTDKWLGANLINNGTIDWQNGNIAFTAPGLTWANTGTLTITGNNNTSGGGHCTLTNTGIITKTSAGSTGLGSMTLTNPGTLNINAGTLVFNNATFNNSATISMTGSTLAVDAGVTVNWNAGSSMTGSGTLNFINPSSWLALIVDMVMPSTFSMVMASNVSGAGNLTCNGPLTLNSYYTEINGTGTLAINENSTWNGARVNRVTTIASGKTLTLTTGTDKWLGANLTNNGTIDWQNGNIAFTAPGLTWTNTGAFMINGNNNTSGGGHCTLTNTGIITKTSAGSTGLGSMTLTNPGTLNINAGTLVFNNSTFNNSALINMIGSTLAVDAGVTVNWNAGSSLTGSGILDFIHYGSWLVLNADMVMPSTFSMIMAANVAGVGNLTCNGPLTLNSFYTEVNGTGTLAINQNSTWNGARVNRATTIASGKTLTITTGTDKALGANLTNNGTIDWQNGGIAITAPGLTWANNGTFTISGNNNSGGGGGSCTLLNSGTIRKTSSGTTIFYSSVSFTNNGTIQGLGTYDLANAITGSGNIAPGLSPGILTLNGAQPLSASGTLQIEMLDGSGPGTGHDQLQRNGNLTLAGNITVTDNPGVPYGTYTIIDLTSGDISGTFATQMLPSGYSLVIDLTNDEVRVTKSPPSSPSDYFRSITTGNWNAPATWESSPVADFSSGVVNPATLSPDQNSNGISIRNGHNVTLNVDMLVNQTTVESGGTLTQTNKITLANVAGNELTIQGTWEKTGGDIDGAGEIEIQNTGVWNNSSSFSAITSSTITNNGVINWTSAYTVVRHSNPTLFNNGTMNFTASSGIDYYNGGWNIVNAGTIVKSGGGSLALSFVQITNNNIFNVTGGTVTYGECNTAQTFNNNGTLTVSGTFNTTCGGNFQNNAGGFIVLTGGTFANINGTGQFHNNAGSTLKGNGTCNLWGNGFSNNGTIEPGASAGTLTMNENGPFDSGSTLNIEMIDGSGPGVGHDQILRNNNLVLTGTINVTESMGFPLGAYTIIDVTGSNTVTGSFSTEILPPGYDLEIIGNNVVLTKYSLVSLPSHYYRSITSGNWNAPGTWESSPLANFSAGVVSPATLAPDASSSGINIYDMDNVSINTPITADQIVVETGSTLTQNTSLTLANGSGDDLTVNGTWTWNDGALTSPGNAVISSTGTLVFTTANNKLIGTNLTNNGTIDWQNGIIAFNNSPTITNAGLWNITGNNNTSFGNSSGTITNSATGMITKTSAGTTNFLYATPFNNSGTINFNGGTIAVGGAGSTTVTNTGALAFNTGALIIQGGTTFNFNTLSTISGTGTFTNNSTLQLNTDLVFPAPLVFTSTNTINGPGNLTINSNFIIQGQILGAGLLTVNANSTWINGTLDRLFTVDNSRTLTINTNNTKSLFKNLTNNGTIDWQDGIIAFYGSPTITNNALWNITGNNNTTFGSSPGTITNAGSGTITKSSVGTTSFTYTSPFNNSGTINFNGGTIALGGVGSTTFTNTGALAFNTGAFIIQGGTTFNYNTLSTVSGTGTFTNNSTLQLNTDVVFPAPLVFASTNTINGPGNLTINNNFTIQGQILGSGLLTVNANSTWINGTLDRLFTVDNSRTLTMNTNNTKSLYKNLTNNGTIDWQDGIIAFYNSPTITNNALWNITGNNNTSFGNSPGTITNTVTGAITKSSSGTTNFTYASPFNNSGTINFNGGTIAIGGAGSTTFTNTGALAFNTGAFIIQGGTTFNYNTLSTVSGSGAFTNNATLNLNTDVVFPAPLVFASTNTINGPGNLTINNNFTIQGQITGPGIMTINANSTWINGSMYRVFSVDATRTLTINTSNFKYLGANLTNSGTIDWQDGAILFVNTPTITNNALWTISANATMQSYSSGANITNAGSITKTNAVSTNIFNVITFLNSGTINCNEGTFYLAPSGTTTFTNTGTLSFGGGTFLGGSSLTFNHNAGAIIKGTGTFTHNGTFNKNGIIAPGVSPGILAMNGAEPFSANTTINIEVLDNSGPGTGHDQITRLTGVTLAGTLNVTQTGSVNPGTFTILTASSITGTGFTVENLPACYTRQVLSNAVQLTKSAPPVVSCPANSTVCISTPAYALSGGMPTGGVYTGTGVSGGNFNPATAGAGTHTITYTVTEGNMCTNTCTFDITVDAQPVADAGANQTQCNTATFTMAAVPSVGTGAWTFVGLFGTAVITSPTSATTTITTVPTDMNITLRWTETNGTCSDDDDVVIRNDAQPVADAGANQTLCNTTTFTMAAVPSVGTGAWTFVGLFGTAVITSPTSATTTITTVPTDMNITLRWTETNGTCSDDDDVVIRNDAQPVADAGANQTLCNTATFAMAAVPSVGTGAWTFVGPFGTAVITSPTSATTTITTVPTDMNITLRWTETNGTCSDDDDVVIRNDAQPVADAGANQTLCNTTTFAMAAVPSVGTGAWTFVGPFGTAVITSPTSATTTVTTVPTDMDITLRWTETNGTCSDDDDVVIRNDAQPVADAGANQTLCNTATFAMAAVPSVGTGAWTFVGLFGTAVITSPTSATTTITTVPTDMNITLRWTETNGTCSDDDDVVIRNDAQPVADAGADQTLCNTATFTMAAVPSVGTGAWTFVGLFGTAVITSPTSATTTVTTVPTDMDITLRWTETNGTCSDDDDVVIRNDAQPVADAGANQTLCNTATFAMAAVPGVGTGAWTFVGLFGTAVITSPTSATTTITTVPTDMNITLRWTETNGTCSDDDDVVIRNDAQPVVSNQPNQAQCDDEDFTMTQSTPSVGTGVWTLESGSATITDAMSPTTTVTDVVAGTSATIRWTVTNGSCSAYDEVTVTNNTLPVVTCPGNSTVCMDDPTFTLTGATPAMGTYTGNGVSGGMFDPADAGTGTHTITYSYTDGNGCTNTCTFTITVTDAEISVTSLAFFTDIFDGDNTPDIADDTDFGSADVAIGMVTHTFAINNDGSTPLLVSSIALSGANPGDFVIGALTPASPIPPTSTSSFTITFDPTTIGLRTATVNINNNDCDETPFDFAIQGIGTSSCGNVENTNTNETFCTIQEAIDDAETLDGHTIAIGSGSYTGTMDATAKDLTFAPGNSPGCVTIGGDMTLNGGDVLAMEANGTTACTLYDQFIVNGMVTLGGATLSLTLGYTPTIGDMFMIIDNDGAGDAVTGQFAQGAAITVGGYTFDINYAGGDGNDVVLTSCAGGVVNTNTTEIFCTIQDAIDDAQTMGGHTITVAAGTYVEEVNINKAITLTGAGSGTTFIDESGSSTAGNVVTIAGLVGNVTVSGFTIKTGTASTMASSAISLSNNTGGTININNCVLTAVQSPSGTANANFGLIAGYGSTSALVFNNNTVNGGGDNPILLELYNGPTSITNNTIYRGPEDAYSMDAIFVMNYGATDITTPQIISGNIIDLGGGTVFTNSTRSAGITVTAQFSGGAGPGGFTNVQITDNIIQNLKSFRRGITLWDNSNGAGDIIATVTGNEISAAVGYTGQFGIRPIGSVTGTIVSNNKISGVDNAFQGANWPASGSPSGAMVNNNSLLGALYGIDWSGGSGILDATCNWYGTTVPAGVAAEINGTVTYIPWLISGADGSGATGFQPSVACAACVAFTINTSTTTANCPLRNDGTASVTSVTGGISPFTYLWSNAATTSSISGLVGGMYTVTVTDINGCTNAATVTVTNDVGPVLNNNTGLTYCTIQAAIDDPLTLNLHTIIVSAGTYAEHVIVNKKLDIRGPNYGISGTSMSRVAEALIVPEATLMPGDIWTEVVYINSSDVSFDGFKISGDNPSLSGYAYAGMDLDKGQCVYSEGNNVAFSNNIVEKATTMGFFAGGAQVAPHYANLVVSNNKFENIHDINQLGYGFAMYIQATTGLISNNTVENSRTGLQVQPYDVISAITPVVTGNTFNVWRSGIWYNYAENGATAWNINGNTVNAINPPVTPTGPVRWQGIAAETMRASSNGGTIAGNTVNGNSLNNPLYWWTTIGLHYAGASSASTAVAFTGNTVSGVKYGMVHDAPADITFNGNTLTAATQAIAIQRQYSSAGVQQPTGGTGNMDATGGNTINGVASGAATLLQLYDIEDAIYHKSDSCIFGLARVRPNQIYVTVNSSSVQCGIDAASPTGDKVNIKAGNYASSGMNASAREVTLAPGSSPGCVTLGADMVLTGGDQLDMELNGTVACTGYDRFIVNGTVTLGGANLNIILGYVPSNLDEYIIINNDLADAVSGTFAQGSSIVVGPYTFVINYAGGDGNDVVLEMCTGETTITTPTLVVENSPMLPASVPDVGVGTYVWSITNGTITSGQGTSSINYTSGSAGTLTIYVTVTDDNGCVSTDEQVVNVIVAGPSSMVWVLDTGDNDGSCPEATNCCQDIICYDLVYTPAVSGNLTTYTTGFVSNCLGPIYPPPIALDLFMMPLNNSCIMSDNSFEIDDCTNSNSYLFNSSGQNGNVTVVAGVAMTIHKVCFNIKAGEVINLIEDMPTNLTASIDFLDINNMIIGQYTDYPAFAPTSITKPLPVIPANVTITVSCESNAVLPVPPVVLDYCGNPVMVALSTIVDNPMPVTCEGTRVYNFIYTDCAGTTYPWSYTYIIDDNVNPTASNPAPVSVECFSDIPAFDITVVTDEADNCGGIPVVTYIGDDINSAVCDGATVIVTRTYRVTDCANNFIDVFQTITVDDVTPPSASNPLPISVECFSDIPAPNVAVVTDEADNCNGTPGVAFVSDNVTSVLCDGATVIVTRTYRVTDCSGNTVDVFQAINVDDVTNPTASNPPTTAVQCFSDIPVPNISVVTDEADNCDGAPIVTYVSDDINSVMCDGATITVIRTYQVADCSGNLILVTQTFNVNDVTPPAEVGGPVPTSSTVGCPLDAVAPDLPGSPAMPVVEDICGNVLSPLGPPVQGGTWTGGCTGTITFTYSYESCSGLPYVWVYTYTVDCDPLTLKVLLEGPYVAGTGTMNKDLNFNHLLPGQDKLLSPSLAIQLGAPFTPFGQPYSGAPWNYNGNSGLNFGDASSPGAPMGVIPYDLDVVDWVLVTVRKNGLLPAHNHWTCAGWVHQDGEVTFPESCGTLALNGADNYYVMVQHRNHLGVLSPVAALEPCSGYVIDWDFTGSNSYQPTFRYGQKMVDTGIWAMHAANGEQITSINAISSADRTTWRLLQGVLGYSIGDYNMSTVVTPPDETIWKTNQNRTSGVIFY